MQAIQFNATVPRYIATRLGGMVSPRLFHGKWSCLRFATTLEPSLPGPDWALMNVRYAGICGSDLNLIFLRDSPAMSPFTSFPFTVGHENVGVIAEQGADVSGFSPGDRVVVDPLLPCAARGIPPCPSCQAGEYNLCLHFAEGKLSPGLLTGACRDTGGSWSPVFVAHRSQLFRVPASLSDEAALMAEPFAVALHAVLRNFPQPGATVLVVGGGVIGQCTVAALRALGSASRIVVLAKHRFQGNMAERLGADQVIHTSRGAAHFNRVADVLGAKLHQPMMGKPVMVGGAHTVFECVGSGRSVDEALRFAQGGGRVVLVGLASVPKDVDWTPIWLNELEVKGSFCYGTETWDNRRVRTVQLALDLMAAGKADLGGLVTHQFPLNEYRRAIDTAVRKGSQEAFKVVFAFPKSTMEGASS